MWIIDEKTCVVGKKNLAWMWIFNEPCLRWWWLFSSSIYQELICMGTKWKGLNSLLLKIRTRFRGSTLCIWSWRLSPSYITCILAITHIYRYLERESQVPSSYFTLFNYHALLQVFQSMTWVEFYLVTLSRFLISTDIIWWYMTY